MTELGYRPASRYSRDPWRSWPPPPENVRAAQSGDEAILTGIAAAGIPKLVAFYRGLGMRPHDAEDLAGDACEAVFRTLPRLRDVERFEPWFWRIARSKYYDEIRRIKRPVAPQLDHDQMHDDPSDLAVLSDEHAAVRRAFEILRPRDRELLWMRDVVGLGYPEIAGRLTLKEGAVRIAVMRARRRLEEAYTEGV